MSRNSKEHALARKEEIMKACKVLYKNLSFKDITIKDIAEYTSFSRPSIYNYFETKEEIFLAIFQNEYENWKEDLDKVAKVKRKLTVKQFAAEISKTIDNRVLLLKLLSMNLYDMEEHSRLERLIEFKEAYASSINALVNAIKRVFPKYTKDKCDSFINAFMPFMIGLYSYTSITDKQKKAMSKAGLKQKKQSVSDLTQNMIIKLIEA